MTAPYGAGYAGLVRVNAPHPRSYGADVPLGTVALNWRNTAEEMKAYCRVNLIRFTGPALCKAIPKPSGTPVCGTATFHLEGQQEMINVAS